MCNNEAVPNWDPSTYLLIVIAVATVYISSIMPPLKDEVSNEVVEEELKWYHTVMFVVFASIALVMIFFFASYLMKIMGFIFIFLAVFILWICLDQILENINEFFKLPLNRRACDCTRIGVGEVTWIELISVSLAIGLTAFYYITDDWMVSNFIAVGYIAQVIRIITIKNMYVVWMLLILMFFFDIYWVFFSTKAFGKSVMLVAATEINLPIKIVWPHIFSTPFKACSLLGLGDMAIPAFAIKFFGYADARLKTGRFYHSVAMIG